MLSLNSLKCCVLLLLCRILEDTEVETEASNYHLCCERRAVTRLATWQQYGDMSGQRARHSCEVYVISRSSHVMSYVTRDVT